MCKGSRFPYPAVKAMGAVTERVMPCHAYCQGLFVLAQAGDSVVILNDERPHPQHL